MKGKYILLFLIFFIIFYTTVYLMVEKPYIAIHKGQVWQWSLHKDDPFRKYEKVIVTVLAVKDGYIQYRYEDNGGISSMRRGSFLVGDPELLEDK